MSAVTRISRSFRHNGTGSITVSGDITGTFTNGAACFLRGTSPSTTNAVTGNITLTGGRPREDRRRDLDGGSPRQDLSVRLPSRGGRHLEDGRGQLLTGAPVLTMGNSTGGSTGSLDLNGFDQTIGGIIYNGAGVSTGTRTITSATAAVLTVTNATDYTATGSGANSVVLTGALGLTKTGAGKLTLAGANTYTGGTTNTGNGVLISSLSTNLNSLGTGGVFIDSGATNQVNNVNTANTAPAALTNTFTGSGLLKINFAAGTTARNTPYPT